MLCFDPMCNILLYIVSIVYVSLNRSSKTEILLWLCAGQCPSQRGPLPREAFIVPLLVLFATQVMNSLYTFSEAVYLLNPFGIEWVLMEVVLKIKQTLKVKYSEDLWILQIYWDFFQSGC